jgi:hypothetical protein
VATRRRSLPVGTLILSSALVLSGCGLMAQLETSTPSPTPTAAPAPAGAQPTPTATSPTLEPGTIVATGHLTGDPLIAGDVEIRVARGSAFELRLVGFTSAREEPVELRISPNLVEPGTPCTSSIMNMSYGDLPTAPDQSFRLPSDFTGGDPSFLDSVLIAHHDFDAFQNGCYVSVLSSAVLTWTLPNMRPGLVVVDSGKTGGANGDVTLADGVPLTYTVAPNDVAEEVAARLGITRSDLFYLNPTRTTAVAFPMLQIGEVLNISKEHR